MNRKRFLSLLLILALTLQLFLVGGCSPKGALKITDCNGDAISDKTYVSLAQQEAAEILAELKDCSLQKAKKLLKSGGYTVKTAYNPTVYTALEEAYKGMENAPSELGCAVTDLNGVLLALFSAGDKKVHHATAAVKPYEAIVPLSVYAPAIENKATFYSSAYLDASLFKEDDQFWPANPNGTYIYKKVPLAEAVEKGLNTAAARILKEFGTDKALEFLDDELDLEITLKSKTESDLLHTLMGEKEITVSPLELAGYYSIFGNYGEYAAPRTVLELSDKKGIVYEKNSDTETVMKDSTATIVTRLLTAATSENGIAATANLGETPVAGTVATGAEGNWFAGLTPQYSCAVWHGAGDHGNLAPLFFKEAFSKLKHQDGATFGNTPNVRSAIYCRESGLLYGKNCTKMQMGCYANDALPETCTAHK